MAFNKMAVLFVVGLLVFGAMNTLSTKLTFQMQAMDLSGKVMPFEKTWFGVYRMFQGMSFVMLIHFYMELRNKCARRKQAKTDAYVALEEQEQAPEATPLKAYFLIIVPALLDMLGTASMYVGLFYNSPSVWQMFRGSMIIFATIFSVMFLGRKMTRLRYLGVAMCVLAICMVGTANVMSTQPAGMEVDPSLRAFGMGMIILGMVLQGGQIVVEEFLMKGVSVPPLLVVGMEGVWGVVLMFVFVFPIVGRIPGPDYGNCQESLDNDYYMVKNSPQLQKVIGAYLISVFAYNIAGMMVTYSLSAVHRTMLEASRTAIIWAIDLAIHNAYPDSSFGEAWCAWSFLQLAGFVMLVVGQATYAEIITWGMAVPSKMASPLLSPVYEPGTPFSNGFPSPQGSVMYSPKGQLDLGVELPEEQEEMEITGFENGKK